MKADDFVRTLLDTCPTMESLLRKGLSEKGAMEERGSYMCVLRPNVAPLVDPLLDLLSRYDCSKVEIGMIRFMSAPTDVGELWQIGKDEADPIVLDKVTGEVTLRSLSHPDHTISKCASTSSRFLDAVALCARSLTHLSEHDPRGEDQEACHRFAHECGNAAGSAAYTRYYMTLLGCW
jgi:hypothetical protein